MDTPGRGYRLSNIDLLRGLAIVVMALDHVRDYFMVGGEQDPMSNPSIGAALFLTRWVTHFCAPVFVFLAGTSVGLMLTRRAPAEVPAFLVKRGLWLVLVEVVVVSTAWSFAPWGIEQLGGSVVVVLGVIWAIGVGMLVLAAAQGLGHRACLLIGATIICGHNLLDMVWPLTSGLFDTSQPLWVALYAQMAAAAGPILVVLVYPVLPWVGVMLLGYGSASVFLDAPDRRNARLMTWGAAATMAFVVIRLTGLYGDPNPWQLQHSGVATLTDFLNVSKYPPSLLYLLMTLGPAAMLCAVADRVAGWVAQPLITFGRAPFAFYVSHLYVIHVLAVGFGVAQGFAARQFLTFAFFFPRGYGVELPAVYLVWLVVVAGLYPFCRWVVAVKGRRRDWWLSYL